MEKMYYYTFKKSKYKIEYSCTECSSETYMIMNYYYKFK